jgi:peptidoglycan/xylan/chitin deacetylase (PgdA/CDA1 family)
VGDPPGDPRYELVPSLGIDLFEEQLDYLRRTCRIVPPSQLLDAVADQRRTDRLPVAITFDDDLQSHVEVAVPVLGRAGVPAAFFVCGSSCSFWWENLQAFVDQPDAEPLRVAALPELDLASAVHRTPFALARAAELIERLPRERRDAVASELRQRAARPTTFGPTELEALVHNGHEIGFHTRHHYLLTTLDDSELATAMNEGRDEIEAIVEKPLRMLAYPHGKADARVARAARAAGFEIAFTAANQPVIPGTNPHLIGRVEIPAGPMALFAETIASILGRG